MRWSALVAATLGVVVIDMADFVHGVSAPLYAALAAATFAADRIPVEQVTRVDVKNIDVWALGVTGGAAALMAATHWLWAYDDLGLADMVIGAVIAGAGLVVVTYAFIARVATAQQSGDDAVDRE